jgi:transposase InsO family protein
MCPIKYTVLTDNGIQFTNHDPNKDAFTHIFSRICLENAIDHRRAKVKHPWTNGQVERINRTLKEATVHTFNYSSHEELKRIYMPI